MIIYNFYFAWPQICPYKTYSITIIDANAVLPLPISCKSLQAIPRGNTKFFQSLHRIKLVKFTGSNLP